MNYLDLEVIGHNRPKFSLPVNSFYTISVPVSSSQNNRKSIQ
jgi:hypothetical protein